MRTSQPRLANRKDWIAMDPRSTKYCLPAAVEQLAFIIDTRHVNVSVANER